MESTFFSFHLKGAGEREKFIKMADEDKDRYLEEMKVWEAKQRGVTLKASKVNNYL